MDWNAAIDKNRKALQRMLALLFALAALAERASRRSRPVRLLALKILIPAEAAARAFVMDMAQGAPATPRSAAAPALDTAPNADPGADPGVDPDAARLSQRFYALALLLEHMLLRAAAGAQERNRVAAGAQMGGFRVAVGALRRVRHRSAHEIQDSPAAAPNLALRALKPP